METKFINTFALITKIDASVDDGNWNDWGRWFLTSYIHDLITIMPTSPDDYLLKITGDPEQTRLLHISLNKELKSLIYHINMLKDDIVDFDVTNTGILLCLRKQ